VACPAQRSAPSPRLLGVRARVRLRARAESSPSSSVRVGGLGFQPVSATGRAQGFQRALWRGLAEGRARRAARRRPGRPLSGTGHHPPGTPSRHRQGAGLAWRWRGALERAGAPTRTEPLRPRLTPPSIHAFLSTCATRSGSSPESEMSAHCAGAASMATLVLRPAGAARSRRAAAPGCSAATGPSESIRSPTHVVRGCGRCVMREKRVRRTGTRRPRLANAALIGG